MLQEYGLAASAGTDDRGNFAARAVEINALENFVLTEATAKVANDDRGIDFFTVSDHSIQRKAWHSNLSTSPRIRRWIAFRFAFARCLPRWCPSHFIRTAGCMRKSTTVIESWPTRKARGSISFPETQKIILQRSRRSQ